MEKRISMQPHKPHETNQPSRFLHTHKFSTDSPHRSSYTVLCQNRLFRNCILCLCFLHQIQKDEDS